MFKIGDFSKLGQVSTHMLRHYDKIGLLKPSHIDKFTDYRYYTIDQLARLNRIIALRNLGFSLEQIGQLLAEGDDLSAEQLRGMLKMRQAEIERQLQAGQEQLREVEARLQQIEQEAEPSPYEIVVKSLPAQAVASIRQLVPTVGEMDYYCHKLFETLYAGLHHREITQVGPEIMLFHTEEYTEVNLDVEAALCIEQKHLQDQFVDEPYLFRELPASELTAALIYEGPFDGVAPAVLALFQWIGLHNHVVAGPVREVHLSGPAHGWNASQQTPILELQVPIQKSGF
ncbi:MAG: MerR family transcriptional regulator [Chloroflexota bacterium]